MSTSADRKVSAIIWSLFIVLVLAAIWFTAALIWGVYAGLAAGRSGEPTSWYETWCAIHFVAAMMTGFAAACVFSLGVT